MPSTYECARGHSNGCWPDGDKSGPKKGPPCEHPKCGRATKLVHHPLVERPHVTPDVREHYNPSLGTVVRSRRHLKDLQKETGSVDYEPSPAQRERNAYALERMKYERSHR